MRPSGRFFYGLMLTGVFLTLWGCLEYEITTRVLPDGRMYRTIIVKGDSSAIFTGSFPVPADSTWLITTRREPRNDKDIDENKVYVYEARKEFANFDSLNRIFYTDSVFTEHISTKVEFRKKFYWFFTRFYYVETYRMLFPFRSEPISHYLNAHELKIYMADEKDVWYSPEHDSIILVTDTLHLPRLSQADSLRFKTLLDSLENKFQTWQKINIYEDFYQLVAASLEKLGVVTDTTNGKAAFYRWLDSMNTIESGLENSEAFINAAATYFRISPGKLRTSDPDGFEAFNRKYRVAAFSLESYTNRIVMPGRIILTNGALTDHNRASWTFKTENFYATDYEMTVASQMINKWFTVMAGLIVLFLAGLILVRKRKQ